MERSIERVSVSKYNSHFILKGGMLVSSLIGIDTRATMDIDTTIRAYPLNLNDATTMIDEIKDIDLDDNIRFTISSAADIMEEHEYSGIRFVLEGWFDNLKQSIKIDISTGDAITPSAVSYSYNLMFEERAISLYTYNIETLLAEKLETIMSRSIANTRMRDFYDVHMIFNQHKSEIKKENLIMAFKATCKKRSTESYIKDIKEILSEIKENEQC